MVTLERARLTLDEREAEWAKLAAARRNLLATEPLLGSTLLVPMGWQQHDSGLVVKTMWDQQVDFTYSQSQSVFDFDTPPSYLGPLGTPLINFNQSDEWLETPNASFWNDSAGSSEPSYCWAFWIDVINSATLQQIITRTQSIAGSGGIDWSVFFTLSETVNLRVFDDSADAFIGRATDSALSLGLHHLVITKSDDNGGGTPTELSSDIIIYVDGEAVAISDSLSGNTYLAQENGTGVTRIGAGTFDSNQLGASLFGAWSGPVFRQVGTGTVWTPDTIRCDFQLGAPHFGLA